ncbi:MAG: DUF1016 N-terminal domain-containing protein [Bacteroidales bacterium]|nr:DUF1016 N-terminal domain-containing protein [Bacteroidales bacterium]
MINSDIIQAVTAIKSAIQQTRYNVMRAVNKEVLSLYYGVGEYISLHSRGENLWGTSAIQMISDCLLQEFPGLKGFSVQNMRKMRQFYESWSPVFGKSDNDFEIRSLTTSELDNGIQLFNNKAVIIRSLTTSVFDIQTLQAFLSVQFTHHYELITKTNSMEERLFYIRKIAAEFWSVEKLKYNLKENLYQKEGSMPNNFARTLPNE